MARCTPYAQAAMAAIVSLSDVSVTFPGSVMWCRACAGHARCTVHVNQSSAMATNRNVTNPFKRLN